MLSLTIFVVSVYAGIFLPTSSMLMHAYGVLYGVYMGAIHNTQPVLARNDYENDIKINYTKPRK